MPAFKSDISFLEKISMGAVGTQRVFEDLQKHGHNPIELERGSMSFKIWKRIKIKRIRVPDILCINCAKRIESRAKTKLEISMSHSFADPERGWDYGLDNNDYVALVVCEKAGERPIDWQSSKLVQYISVKDLRQAHAAGYTKVVKAKGAEEGFEARIIWPSVIAKYAGIVKTVDEERIQYCRRKDNRTITLRLRTASKTLTPLVRANDQVSQHQVLASVVPVTQFFPCSKAVPYTYYTQKLSSPSLSERYTATKALSMFSAADIYKLLLDKLSNNQEHIYVRLEASASLARLGKTEGWAFIKKSLADQYLQNRLEAVIVLSEIKSDTSCQMLCGVLQDSQQPPEIRAGAAWALGELNNKLGLNALVSSFSTLENDIRVEAARALAKLALIFTPEIVDKFPKAGPQERAGIAWALSKSSQFKLDELLKTLVDEDARHWVAYILGSQPKEKLIGEIEKLKAHDPYIYFAVTLLWKIMTSWVYDLKEYG
ncbi:MAG: HEAT repeat domain-containing protein [Nitrososphaerota archaeon]